MAASPDENYVAFVLREFRRLKTLGDRAMMQIRNEQFFAPPGEMGRGNYLARQAS